MSEYMALIDQIDTAYLAIALLAMLILYGGWWAFKKSLKVFFLFARLMAALFVISLVIAWGFYG
jgi:ethanolamine transporter EutH